LLQDILRGIISTELTGIDRDPNMRVCCTKPKWPEEESELQTFDATTTLFENMFT